jgi:hypothetical protein
LFSLFASLPIVRIACSFNPVRKAYTRITIVQHHLAINQNDPGLLWMYGPKQVHKVPVRQKDLKMLPSILTNLKAGWAGFKTQTFAPPHHSIYAQ